MRSVLITGGTGFVGANLVRRLLDEGCEVHLLVRQGFQAWRIASVQDRVQLHVVDMNVASAVLELLSSLRPAWVFHLAAHGAYSFQTDAQEMVRTNLIATMNLVQAFLQSGGEALVHAGSSSEYGVKDHPPTESEQIEPNSDYAVTKAAATLYCGCAARKSHARIITLRLYSAFGPFEDPRRFLPALVVKGLAGKLPPLVSPDVCRDFVYVEDVCDAFIRAASVGNPPWGAVYNLGSGVQTSIGQMVALARQELSIPEEPRWQSMPDRSWDTSTWVSDSTRIARDLEWKPRHALADGFRAMVSWFRDNPAMLEFYRTQQRGG